MDSTGNPGEPYARGKEACRLKLLPARGCLDFCKAIVSHSRLSQHSKSVQRNKREPRVLFIVIISPKLYKGTILCGGDEFEVPFCAGFCLNERRKSNKSCFWSNFGGWVLPAPSRITPQVHQPYNNSYGCT